MFGTNILQVSPNNVIGRGFLRTMSYSCSSAPGYCGWASRVSMIVLHKKSSFLRAQEHHATPLVQEQVVRSSPSFHRWPSESRSASAMGDSSPWISSSSSHCPSLSLCFRFCPSLSHALFHSFFLSQCPSLSLPMGFLFFVFLISVSLFVISPVLSLPHSHVHSGLLQRMGETTRK